MNVKNFFAVLVVLISSVFTSCSKEEDVFEYSNEQKGEMAFLSYTNEDWVPSTGPNLQRLIHSYIFAIVHGDRLTGDYYYVNDGEREEIRIKMLYGEELVFFPGDSEKSIWNAKVETFSKIAEKKTMPQEYAIEITGSNSAEITVKNIYGARISLSIGFNSFDAEDLDR